MAFSSLSAAVSSALTPEQIAAERARWDAVRSRGTTARGLSNQNQIVGKQASGVPIRLGELLSRAASGTPITGEEKQALDTLVMPIIDKLSAGTPLTFQEQGIAKIVGLTSPQAPSTPRAPSRGGYQGSSSFSRSARGYQGMKITDALFSLISDARSKRNFRKIPEGWQATTRAGDVTIRRLMSYDRQARMIMEGARVESIVNMVYKALPPEIQARYTYQSPGRMMLKPTAVTLSDRLYAHVFGALDLKQFKKVNGVWQTTTPRGKSIVKWLKKQDAVVQAIIRGQRPAAIARPVYIILPKEFKEFYVKTSDPLKFVLKPMAKRALVTGQPATKAKQPTPPPTQPPASETAPKSQPSAEAQAVAEVIKESPEAREVAVQALVKAGKPRQVAVREVREVAMVGRPASNVISEAVKEAAPPGVVEHKIQQVKTGGIPILPILAGALGVILFMGKSRKRGV